MWVGQKLNGGAIQVQMWFISNSSTVEVTQQNTEQLYEEGNCNQVD